MANHSNNFESFKKDFEHDTKLSVVGNMQAYIAYYNARCSDITMQQSIKILSLLESKK